jgi:hypothetical protein
MQPEPIQPSIDFWLSTWPRFIPAQHDGHGICPVSSQYQHLFCRRCSRRVSSGVRRIVPRVSSLNPMLTSMMMTTKNMITPNIAPIA